ncbi:DUF262 domain-containing protein [Rhodoglobus aureus]|uniref:DUF262 domain-containing protein n=1 Tax=Rhodoglobus aureus TaxID=191497 RepID=A0ABP4G9K6_9MICO
MGHLPPKTIAAALREIQESALVLPAIQREYVWKPSQVLGLFDSVMRGYPIGSFLAWKIEPETVQKFKFYGFMKDYNQLSNRHNPDLDLSNKHVTAMLDGQQRLTSLNIGLRGSYAVKSHGGWTNNPNAYPVRRLYLNVLGQAEENEAGLMYDFKLLTEQQVADVDGDNKHWFSVAKVFDAETPFQLMSALQQAGLGNQSIALDMLGQLHQAVHSNPSLHFYEESQQDVERVLDIFIRVNSGGTVLSYSDLLLSIATAQWKDRDARDAIHGLVDALNNTGQGFKFSQDVVLKSGLMLAGVNDIAFKVKNFTAENMTKLDESWDSISDSLKVAAGLLSDFGLADATLSAKSVIIPVAYYVHRRNLNDTYRERPADAEDRALLRSWVLRSLIARGIWGSGLDTLLRDLRDVLKIHGAEGFPVAEIERAMATRGKSLAVTTELVDDVLALRYGGARTFAVLAMIFDHVDTRNTFHVDHVFPRSLLETKTLREQGLDTVRIEKAQSLQDLLPNLQLLSGPDNIIKSATPPDEWATRTYPTPDSHSEYMARNELPTLPHTVDDFAKFFNARRDALAKRIRMRLSTNLANDDMFFSSDSPVIAEDLSFDEEQLDAAFDD